jgi:aspartyl protease family protein
MRLDWSSIGVMVLATASSLATAGYLGRMGEPAQAAAVVEPAPRVAQMAVARPAPSGPAHLPKDRDGHFWADARISAGSGDRSVRLMVDTGASVVALTRDDARRLGFRLQPADFTGTVITASGQVRAAPVQLGAVSIGSARVDRVEALVVETGLTHSLLGMSYLGRLSGFTATPTGLTLEA